MGLSKSGKKVFDDAVSDTAHSSLQAVTGLASSTQAQVNTAQIAYYKSAVTSGVANGVDVGSFIFALKILGATP